MTRAAATLIALALCTAVAGCSSVKAGVVIEKAYDDPDTWTSSEPVYRQQCRSVPRRTTYVNDCTQVVSYYETVDHYDPPHWRLRLRNAKGDTGWLDVDQITYHRTRIGARYPGRAS